MAERPRLASAAGGVAWDTVRWPFPRTGIAAEELALACVRRALDVLITLLLLPFLMPVMLLCAIAVRIASAGPAFESSLHSGLGGHGFTLWRLRTGPTRLGRFLRTTHIEDLPQLLNVLRGEMSLVGPRPSCVGLDEHPLWHTARLEVKPGITGLAQVSALSELDTDRTVRLDIAYVRTRTIGGDARILLRSMAIIAGAFHDAFQGASSASSTAGEKVRDPGAEAPGAARTGRMLSLPQLGANALILADAAAVALALGAAYVLRFAMDVGPREIEVAPPAEEYFKLYLLLGATTAISVSFQQLYRKDSPHNTMEETYAVAKAVTFATTVGLAIAYFYRDYTYSRLTFTYFWILAVGLVAGTHAIYRHWLVGRYARGLDLSRTIVVGTPGLHLLQRLRTEPAFGLALIGWMGPSDALQVDEQNPDQRGRAGVLLESARLRRQRVKSDLPRLGSIEEAASVIGRTSVDRVIIVEYGLTHTQLLETIDACEQNGVDVQLIPPIYDLLIDAADLAVINGVPTLRIDEARSRRTQEALKRMFDVVASAALLLLLAPLMLAVAIGIRRTSAGPALFRQTRAGRHGRPFEMLKFRTMVSDAEARLNGIIDINGLTQPVFKIVNDPRITPLGRWLRRFSIDELPQLINVLKGEMSLVGPRPEEFKIVRRYDVWQRRRLKMKPGITGLQQVVARGALSDLTERVRLDIYYIRKQCFLFDMLILGRTVGAVLSGRGAT